MLKHWARIATGFDGGVNTNQLIMDEMGRHLAGKRREVREGGREAFAEGGNGAGTKNGEETECQRDEWRERRMICLVRDIRQRERERKADRQTQR